MKQRNILILGASGDIGSEIARELAAEGYSLILHYHLNRAPIESICKHVPVEAVLQTIQADLTTEADLDKLIAEVSYAVHGLIIVSGTAQFGLFQDIMQSEMDKMLTLHVTAPLRITQRFLPEMIQRQSGNIIFITSKWGTVGSSNEVIYSTVKGAQNSFVRALSKEVGPSGVNVNAISPGFIDTKMNSHLLADERDEILSQIPLNRAGTPVDVAHIVKFMMDEKSTYIQGEIINITGGW